MTEFTRNDLDIFGRQIENRTTFDKVTGAPECIFILYLLVFWQLETGKKTVCLKVPGTQGAKETLYDFMSYHKIRSARLDPHRRKPSSYKIRSVWN